MLLSPPFIISSALAPGLRIGDVATLSLLDVSPAGDTDPATRVMGDRDRARFELYFNDGREPYVDDQLRSGVGGFRSPVEAFEAFLGFLEAAAESSRYGGDNTDLFPTHIVEWAAEHIDDINRARCSICDEDGNPNISLIEEN